MHRVADQLVKVISELIFAGLFRPLLHLSSPLVEFIQNLN
jgi:hypothetical protein